TDDNYRRASVLSALSSRLDAHCSGSAVATAPKKIKAARDYLKAVRMPKVMTDAAYAKAFHAEQQRLHDLQREARAKGVSTIVVFEGWDAAGKGGAIRRLTFALNARDYKVVPISAPNEEEQRYHYLWRFWRRLARAGDMTVFDRSWYGRVLVERVEKLIDKPTYVRGYSEINTFERQLHEGGHVIVKFWLHITKAEQKRRFKERRETPYKSWKLTKDDRRNRKKWKAYERAVNDMLENTSPATAPWTVIGANDKQRTRITVLQTVSDALARALRQHAGKNRRQQRQKL
ncbi:MAG: polyphosphate kinase, partial [Rhodospirillaceae bacterium]|nr:polyphosphate kinase [Rhodospirillaceae bacterium]